MANVCLACASEGGRGGGREKKKQRGKRESRVCPRPPVGSALVPLCQQVRTLLRYEERVEPKEETALRVRTKIGR